MSGSGADSPPVQTSMVSMTSAAAGVGGVVGVDPDALRRFRFAISRAAHPDYPRLAVERGWSGTTQIRVFVDNDVVRSVSVGRSSGYAMLDTRAKEIIGRAARATPIPQPLQGREFVVDLPVEFKLDNRLDEE